MRKLLTYLSLCLLLLGAQQSALLHELSHFAAARQHAAPGAAQPRATLDTRKALETTCALCLTYSQLANAATPTSFTFHFHATPCTVESTVIPPLLPLAAPIARSRGPPPQLNA